MSSGAHHTLLKKDSDGDGDGANATSTRTATRSSTAVKSKVLTSSHYARAAQSNPAGTQPPIVAGPTSHSIRQYDGALYQNDAWGATKWGDDLVPSNKEDVVLVSMEHAGLLVNYLCIGILNGLLPTMVYPFFKLYLNMASYQTIAAGSIITMPWSYKTIFGFMSDHYPILGYRRKSYILIGWAICLVALMTLAFGPKEEPFYKPGELQRTEIVALRVVHNQHAPDAGERYLIQLMFVCLGFVVVDVACDGIMVELAQHEHIDVRGSVQSTIYTTRFLGNVLGGLISAFSFNGQEYGGTFAWSVPYAAVFIGCGLIVIMGMVSTVLALIEEPFSRELDQHPYREMWRIVKQRAVWQMMAFHFCNSLLCNFGFSGVGAIQEYWVHIDPFSNSLASCFSLLLCVIASIIMKHYLLNTSWRWLMVIFTLMSAITTFMVGVVVTFDILRSPWFYLAGPQLALVPDGMRHIVSGFVTVEIAEHGFEGATFSLLVTMHNLASPFATSLYNLVDSYFSVADSEILTDSTYVRWQVAKCLCISLAMQLLSLGTLAWLPNQKREAQALKYHGTSSRAAGIVALLVPCLALVWSVTLSLLSIRSSTACLRIAGGHGCS